MVSYKRFTAGDALKPHLYKKRGIWHCALGIWLTTALTPAGAYNKCMMLVLHKTISY